MQNSSDKFSQKSAKNSILFNSAELVKLNEEKTLGGRHGKLRPTKILRQNYISCKIRVYIHNDNSALPI